MLAPQPIRSGTATAPIDAVEGTQRAMMIAIGVAFEASAARTSARRAEDHRGVSGTPALQVDHVKYSSTFHSGEFVFTRTFKKGLFHEKSQKRAEGRVVGKETKGHKAERGSRHVTSVTVD